MTYICAHANLYIHLNPPLSWIPWENDLFDVMYAEKINSVWNTLISVIIFDVEGIVFLYKLHPPLTAYNGHARVQTYIYWWEMLLQIHLCVNNDLMWRNYSFYLSSEIVSYLKIIFYLTSNLPNETLQGLSKVIISSLPHWEMIS